MTNKIGDFEMEKHSDVKLKAKLNSLISRGPETDMFMIDVLTDLLECRRALRQIEKTATMHYPLKFEEGKKMPFLLDQLSECNRIAYQVSP
jgi:hypothetical protein